LHARQSDVREMRHPARKVKWRMALPARTGVRRPLGCGATVQFPATASAVLEPTAACDVLLGNFEQQEMTMMKTPSGHTRAILASKVKGTNVYSTQGDSIGHVEDIVLDKMSNEILFAVVGFGGFIGVGEKFHPVPWSSLDYSPEKDGYVIGFTREMLERAPAYDLDELTAADSASLQRATDHFRQTV
jgi:sporulation protein YlmC with PRC-barrel domain